MKCVLKQIAEFASLDIAPSNTNLSPFLLLVGRWLEILVAIVIVLVVWWACYKRFSRG